MNAPNAVALTGANPHKMKYSSRDIARGVTAGKDGKKVVLGVRPENLREAERQVDGPPARVTGTVEFVEPLGHEVIVHAKVGDDLLVAKLEPHRAPQMGDPIELAVVLSALHLFAAESEARLDPHALTPDG